MVHRWDDWEVDVPARTITGPDGRVHAEPQVFDVLAYLIEHRDRVVSKEELLDEIWGDQFVSESAVTSRIKSARRAIGDDGRTQRYIRNVHGRGYQFVGRMESPDATATPIPSPTDATTGPQPPASIIGLDDEFPFVGRDDEVAAARSALGREDPALVLIGGEPGIGKSRLAVHLLDLAVQTGCRVGAGRCSEHVSAPLQPVRDAVAQLAAAAPGQFRAWSDGLATELKALIPSLPFASDVEARAVDGYAAVEVLLSVVDRAATHGPVAILIDDLQWSDDSTRRFVSRALRLRGRPLGLLATFRSSRADLPVEVARWISEERRTSDTTAIDLRELDESAARRLVDTVLGDASETIAERLVTRTAGHGLFLTESIRDVLTGGNSISSVSHMVAERLERLDGSSQNLVRSGAFLGPEFSFHAARDAAGLEPTAAMHAVDLAIRAELLHETPSPDRFRFSHQMVPEAIKESTSGPAAAAIHHECARALEAVEGRSVEVAHHLLGSIPLIPASDAVQRAGAVAAEATAAKQFDRAIRLLESCVAIADDDRVRAELSIELGRVGNASGRAVTARVWFEQAASLAERNGWDDVLVDAALGHLGSSPYRRLRDTTTLELLAKADARLGRQPSIAKARVLAKTAAFSRFTLSTTDCLEMIDRALGMADDATPLERLELLEFRSIVLTNPAGVAELRELDAEMERIRRSEGVFASDAAVPETWPFMMGDGDGFRSAAREDEARIRAQPIAEWRDLTLNSTLSAFEGDFDRARRLCDDAGRIGWDYWGDSAPYLHALGQVFVADLSGDWDRAIELMAGLLESDRSQLLLLHAAWARFATGDDAGGADLYRRLRTDVFSWFPEYILGGNALVAAAEVALAVGEEDFASSVEQAIEPLSHLMLGVPWASSFAAADVLARLARFRGDEQSADAYSREAQRVYEGLGAPALLARLS